MEEKIQICMKDIEKQWNEFADNIKYKNRYFVKKTILQAIDNIIEYSKTDPLSSYSVYRARIGNFLNSKDKEMRSPPMGKPPDGRGNPKGISYFYTSSDIGTAISEVRPFKSSIVTVAKFKSTGDIHVIDFRASSVWQKTSGDNIPISLEEKCFLNIVLSKLAKPVLPENTLDYIPLQYITEYIKIKGYDGLIYKSVLGNGYNLLFFNDSKFELKYKRLYEVTQTKYSFKPTELSN